MEQRIFFLDNVKSGIIWLMVIFHAAMSYMEYAPEWWYVLNEEKTWAATVFVVWADVFIMPIMFFISGYFGIASLSKQRAFFFWKHKWQRVGIPWIIGSIAIAPYIAYLMIASRAISMSFSYFYTTLFWGPAYQQAHYWYLGFLMALYGVLFLVCQAFPGIMIRMKPQMLSGRFFAAIAVISTTVVAIVNNIVSDVTWVHPLYILCLQPTRAPLYIISFFMGAYGWKNQWFSSGGYMPDFNKWGFLFVSMSVIYLLYRLMPVSIPFPVWQCIIGAALHSIFCLVSIFTIIAIFHRFFNTNSIIWQNLEATSYPIYYIHQIIVQNAVWIFRPVEMNLYVKYGIVCVISLALSFFISKYMLIRLPFFKIK